MEEKPLETMDAVPETGGALEKELRETKDAVPETVILVDSVLKEEPREMIDVARKRQGGLADCVCGETVFSTMRYCPGCGRRLQWAKSTSKDEVDVVKVAG